MSLLTTSEAKNKIAEQVRLATDQLHIISAFCKKSALEFIENNRTDENFANLYETDGNIYNAVSSYVLAYKNGESYIAVSSSAVIDDLSYTLKNRSQLA